jgi:nicotinamidase/pyrazinamidase
MEYSSTTALIVVDVQNDFASPDGSLYVNLGETVIPFINKEIESAIEAGATLVYTQDWHPPTTPHFEKDGGIWPVHCVADSPGAELHPELEVHDDAIFIRKGVGGEDGYSAFNVRDPLTGQVTPTGLGDRLARNGIGRAIVVGLALDYCVKETAIDAAELFDTVVPADGTRAVGIRAGDGPRAVAALVSAGVAIT